MKIISNLFNPVYGYVRSIIAVLFGAALVIWPEVSLTTIVQVIGIALIVVGIIPLLGLAKNQKFYFLSATGVFDILLGIVLLVSPKFFVSLIMIVVGIFFITFGVGQLTNLYNAKKYSTVSWRFYVLPVCLTLFGIILLFNPFSSTATILMMVGIALMVYGISEIISTVKVRKAMKNSGLYEQDVEDATYEEVKD